MLYEPILLKRKYDCTNLSVRVDTATDRTVRKRTGTWSNTSIRSRSLPWTTRTGAADAPGPQPFGRHLGAGRRLVRPTFVNTIGDGRAGELAEETGLEAPQWPSLVDLPPSPTMSTEVCRMYQAQQLPRRRRSGHAEGEESYLQFRWPTLPMLSVVGTRRQVTNGGRSRAQRTRRSRSARRGGPARACMMTPAGPPTRRGRRTANAE
jgi:hypothetical protein